MNMLRNRVQLIGHLGADPEIKNTPNGNKVVNLRIATTERYRCEGAWKADTQWHNLALWERLAEKAKTQLHKGSFVLVEGKLTQHTYANEAGQNKYVSEIKVIHFIIMGKKAERSA